MKNRRFFKSLFIAGLSVISSGAFAITQVMSEPIDKGYKSYYTTVMVDKCVLTEKIKFKEINADSFAFTLKCRDFDDPTGTVFTIHRDRYRFGVPRSEMLEMRDDPKYNAGQVWMIWFDVKATDVVRNRDSNDVTAKKGRLDFSDGATLSSSPWAKVKHLMTLQEAEKEYQRTMPKATRPIERVNLPNHFVIGEYIDFSSATLKNDGIPDGKRKATLRDLMETQKGKTFDQIKKALGEPSYEINGNHVIDAEWTVKGGGILNNACYVNFYFDKKNKKVVGWKLSLCEEERDGFGFVPESTPDPEPYKGPK